MQPREADTTNAPIIGATDQPADGLPDFGIPGSDRPEALPDRNDDLPEKLGQRIENGSSSGMATGEPDVLPDVEVPEHTM